MLELRTAEWGWTGIFPGFGVLGDEFPEPKLKVWDLNLSEEGQEGGYVWFSKEKGVRVRLRPFMGEMGVARGVKGKFSTIPPYNTGGNIDTRYVTKGSKLFLPVEVEGALFSVGVSL